MRDAIERLIAGTSLAAPQAVSDADRQRLAALGYVGNAGSASLATSADRLPDPKDKAAVLEEYRRATDLAGQMKYEPAIAAYKSVLAQDPEMTDVWSELAQAYVRVGRSADAVDAYRHIIERNPKSPEALIGAGNQSMRLGRLDEAQQYGELAGAVAPAFAHELLARVAIQRKDAAAARREADLTEQADPSMPMRAIVEGTLLYNAGKYAECIAPFAAAEKALQRRTVQVPDIAYYIGDSLARLGRYPEAERFLTAEVALFPFNVRARAGLAMLYRATGRDAESERAIADMLRVSPEGDGPAMARQLWTMFGEPQKAAALKAAGKSR